MLSGGAAPPVTARASAAVTMGSTADFKVGLTIEFEDQVWKVQEFLHVKPGKGSAFVRSKLKNLQTGSVLEKTWKAGESFPDAQVRGPARRTAPDHERPTAHPPPSPAAGGQGGDAVLLH